MHTTKATKRVSDGRDVRFHHNQDLSGDVIVSVDGASVSVPAAALWQFVGRKKLPEPDKKRAKP